MIPFDIERQKEHFKNHVATLTDMDNIKVLDFKKPDSNEYRIRFLFEEDYCILHISGDLGALTATNVRNMTFDRFHEFMDNPNYFREKIDCIERDLWYWDEDLAKKQLAERLDWYEPAFGEPSLDDVIDDAMQYFSYEKGMGEMAREVISELDPDCFEWLYRIGRYSSGILEVYLLAFKMAIEQLNNKTIRK